MEVKTKIACDGRQLEWKPELRSEIDEDTGEPYEWDAAEPGLHEPLVMPVGLRGMKAVNYLMTHGRVCEWCKAYRPSPMETVMDDIIKPDPFWQFIQKKMGR